MLLISQKVEHKSSNDLHSASKTRCLLPVCNIHSQYLVLQSTTHKQARKGLTLKHWGVSIAGTKGYMSSQMRKLGKEEE